MLKHAVGEQRLTVLKAKVKAYFKYWPRKN